MSDFNKVIACLKGMGMKRPSVNDFQDKLMIQKAVYLLQLKGVKTGFHYGLYVRGPYSPELTKELYAHKSELQQLKTTEELTKKETEAVGELKELLGLNPGLLEVAATYSYFAFGRKEDPITALKNVRTIKPFYSETQIAVGISRAKEYLFKPTGKELAELRKELEPWQKASAKSWGNG